jgi:hypothetical protein
MHAARNLVEEAMAVSGCLVDRDDALLLVGEVVANGLKHAGLPVVLKVRAELNLLRVEVSDPSVSPPRLRSPGLMDESGRGVWMVDQLSSTWGSAASTVGKTVWFEMSTQPRRWQ